MGEARRRRADREDRRHEEQHQAIVELVRAGRRVQRRLVDCVVREDDATVRALSSEIDVFAEASAVVRLVVRDDGVQKAAKGFEERAKTLQRQRNWDSSRLQLSYLITAAQEYEDRRRPGG